MRHDESVRHEWNPLSDSQLNDIYNQIDVSYEDRYNYCISILSNMITDIDKVLGRDLSTLEMLIGVASKRVCNADKKLIKSLRDITAIRFSSNKFRMLYHMKASGSDYEKVNDYHACRYMLDTWAYIYGSEWQSEPYHIDHIIPLSMARDDKEVRKLNRLDNLCMLYTTHNISKGNRFPSMIYYKMKGFKR